VPLVQQAAELRVACVPLLRTRKATRRSPRGPLRAPRRPARAAAVAAAAHGPRNAAAVTVADYLDWYAEDEATAVGLAYLEGIVDGRALLDRPAFAERTRARLVGLRPIDAQAPLSGGEQLTRPEETQGSLGYITSAVYSPTLHTWIALALLSRAIPQGSEMMARDSLRNQHTRVRITPAVHLDAEGSRMRA